MSVGKAIAGAGAWAWDNFGDQVKPGFISFLKRKWTDAKEENEKLRYSEKKWKDFNWGQAAERYKEHMQKIYGHIRVIGTTEPIPIGDIYTDVYILEKPRAYRRFDITKLRKLQEEPERLDNVERIRGLNIVVRKNGHRLYILGKPGAGKTTFMKYLVNQTIIANELDKLPIFVTLREWNVLEESILDFIAKQFKICNFPDARPFIEYLLENGRAVVLFDGLDEIPQENKQRDKTVQALHDFSKQFLDTQTIITCRVAASDYSFTEFTYIEMADFSSAQVEAYARNWFQNDTKTADLFLKELNLDENKGIRDLGRSPLLLSMICLAYAEMLSIPKRRVELYEEALDALLKKWDSSRKIKRDEAYKRLSLGHKKEMFAQIAAEYFDKGEIFFSKREASQKIEKYITSLPPNEHSGQLDGEAILDAISAQHGILVERAKGIYSFSHLTFQEYYTAKYIVADTDRNSLDRLAYHLSDRRWREVFLLTASLLHEASPLFSSLQKSSQHLLAEHQLLLATQSWASLRASRVRGYKINAAKSIYWYLSINLVRDRDRNFDRALDRVLDQDLDRDCRAFDHVLDSALDRLLDRAIDRVLALNLGRAISRAIGRSLALDRALDLSRALARDRARALALALDRAIAQDSLSLTHQSRQSIEFLSFDINSINLLLFIQIFRLLSKENRSKVFEDKLQEFFVTWQRMPISPLKDDQIPSLPSYRDSDQEWSDFHKVIFHTTEYLLKVNLKENWNESDLQVATEYLEANQLFWDCLQVARVEDREAIENLIFTSPKDEN